MHKASADRVRAQGVRLAFYEEESDILLLQQLSEIPRDFKPFFMGGLISEAPKWALVACARAAIVSWNATK